MGDHSPFIKWTPDLYSRLSKYYDRLAPIFHSIGEVAKIQVAGALDSGTVLDIACGTGSLLVLAHRKGLGCFGMDNAAGMIAESKAKLPEGEFTISSFYHIPYPDNAFDYVVETNAVSGVAISVKKVIAEMVRVCKPGGAILIGDYCKGLKESVWTRLIVSIGRCIGDYPHNFAAIFREMGLEPEVEILGWGGMYQYIKVIKT